MALPAIIQPVSYPDPLHEVSTVANSEVTHELTTSEPAEHWESAQDEQDDDKEGSDRSSHRLPPVVSLKEFGKNPLPAQGIIKPGWLDTSYQKALARVRERIIVQRKQPRNAEEWRYPKAPAPARPDLTRKFPLFISNDVKDRLKRRKKHRRSETYPQAASDNVDADSRVTFLPPLPMHSLYQNLFTDLSSSFPSSLLSKKFRSIEEEVIHRPIYLPFVGTASLHPKVLSETEIRDKPYVLPALCASCRGDLEAAQFRGFVEVDEGTGSEVEVKGEVDGGAEGQLVKDSSAIVSLHRSVCFGCALSKTPHFHHAKPRRIGGGFTFFSKEPRMSTFAPKEVTRELKVPPSSFIHSSDEVKLDDRNDILMSVEKLPEPSEPVHESTIPREVPTKVPQWILDMVHHHGDDDHKAKHYQNHCYACLQVLQKLLPDYNPKDFSESSSSGIGTSIMSEARIEEEAKLEEEARLRMEARAREKQRQEEERLKREEYERERRKHLYKAPKAFQPKKLESKTTEAQDPFSKDRNLDIPKNEGFKVKKSTKAVTKTMESGRHDNAWNEPDKFELRKPAQKVSSTEWKAPERKERLRPETPPLPPPPPIAKKPTVPIVPKKRDITEPIASLREPVEALPKKKLEKTKFVKPPIKKVEKEPLPPPPPAPEPVKAKIPPPKKKPVPKAETPPPRPIEVPPKVIERTKPIIRETRKPVKKEDLPLPPPPKVIEKRDKIERKPIVIQRDEKIKPEVPLMVKKKPKEALKKVNEEENNSENQRQLKMDPILVISFVNDGKDTPGSITTSMDEEDKQKPPKAITPPPPPQEDSIPKPPTPKEHTPDPTPPPPTEEPSPKETTPPPREPTPSQREPTPPPRDPTPPPREPTPIIEILPLPPKDPTPPPPEPEPEPVFESTAKKPARPKPQRKKPPKPIKKKTKKETETAKIDRGYMDIPQVMFRQPAPTPEPPKEPTPEPDPEPLVEPEPEPEPPKLPTPAPSPLPPPPAEPEAPPAPVTKPVKKNRNAKMPKPAQPKKPIAVKAKKLPDKPKKKSKPFIMPVIQKLPEPVEPPPFSPSPEPTPNIEVPPLPPVPIPEEPMVPTPVPEVELPPLTPPLTQEPIVMRRRREYKPKKRKWRKTEATPTDGQESPEPIMIDALDYLAKYCIVHKQRIPHYQHVFNGVLRKKGVKIEDTPSSVPTMATLQVHNKLSSNVGESLKSDYDNASVTTETSGYASAVNDDPASSGDEFKRSFGIAETINEEDYISPMVLTSSRKESGSGEEVDRGGASHFFGSDAFAADEYLDKLAFQLDNLYKKSNALQLSIIESADARRRTIAGFARQEFPEILRPGYDPNAVMKANPKGKKKKGEVKFISVVEELGFGNQDDVSHLEEVHPENDDWVLDRLTTSHLQMLESDPSVRRLDLEHERAQEKYEVVQDRIAGLLDEKARVALKESSMRGQELLSRAASNDDFRRKQSILYQKMNPVQEHEVDVTDLEPSLRQVNSYLITEKECQYIYHVLDLPQRHRIDFKLFTVVAALSEKVSRLEPFIRKMINKMNFEALEVKMQRAKELFFLLADEDDAEYNGGEVPISNLIVDLEAGGLNPEHVNLVAEKFNREGKGTVDFLDFLTYTPLFIDIHENIISNPLSLSRER